jgi:hypothetical protein
VSKKKSISEEIHNFQNTQEEDVQVVAPFQPKNKPWKVTSKKR